MLHYKLITTDSFDEYLDCNSDLSDRIKNKLNDYTDFTSFCQLLKSKNMEYSRISRALCHILLGITDSDFKAAKDMGYCTYIRMLGFSKDGSSILSNIKEKGAAPLLTAPDNSIINKYDILSSDILRAIVTSKTGTSSPTEYTRKFELVNI